MSKTKTKSEVPAVLDTAIVKSTIDISVSSSDLMNAIIEEKLELLEKEISSLNIQFKDACEQVREFHTKFSEEFRSVRSEKYKKEFKDFSKFYTKYDTKIKDGIHLEFNGYAEDGKPSNTFHFVFCFSDNYVEEMDTRYFTSKQSLAKLAERDLMNADQKQGFNLPSTSYYIIYSERNDHLYKIKEKVSDKDKLEYKERFLILLKHKNELLQKLHDTKVEYLTYLYGKDRIKSRLIKSNLEMSKEGREILSRITKVTKL